MDNSLVFLYAVYIVSIIILVVAGIIAAAFVIPLQLKEARVKNGLARLRKQMLAKGIFTEIVIIFSLFSLTGRFIIHDTTTLRYTITLVILFFALFILFGVVLDYLIYNQNYTEKNKKLHEKIEQMENEEIDKPKKK